jgi:hypothetical protein
MLMMLVVVMMMMVPVIVIAYRASCVPLLNTQTKKTQPEKRRLTMMHS